MEKIIITIDVSRIDRNQIKERRYTDKQGHEVIAKELKLEVIPLRESKVVKEGENWKAVKTHFVAEAQTKEQREKNEKSKIIGNGIVFKKKVEPVPANTKDEINPEDIPF